MSDTPQTADDPHAPGADSLDGMSPEVRKHYGLSAENDRRPTYCRRCDFYTDHVSTAHDGLGARGLLRAKGEGFVTCADCGHEHTPDRCVGEPTASDVWAGVAPETCDCPGPGAALIPAAKTSDAKEAR